MHKYRVLSGNEESSEPGMIKEHGSRTSRRLAPIVVTFATLTLLSFGVAVKNSSQPGASTDVQPRDLPRPKRAHFESNSSIILMISFPNSGTTYTMSNVEAISDLPTASSYDNEVHYEGKPLFVGEPHKSPYITTDTLDRPRFFMTKSHCRGMSVVCHPRYEPIEFEQTCMSIFTHKANGKAVPHPYHELPAKAVHLVRDPHDNLVARMHFYNYYNDNVYSRDEAGFREWCSYVDSLPGVFYNIRDQLVLSADTWNLPCLSEWFRYVQWHNNAVAMLDSHDYPVLTVHYEDYSLDYRNTVDTLIDFLELEPVQPPLEFIANKTYHSYFDARSKQLAAEFVRQVATPECWRVLQRYF